MTDDRVATARASLENAGGELAPQLLQQIANGDRLAFRHLYSETCRLVLTIVRRIVADESLAEDVTADVFVQVWRNAGRFDASRGSVKTWLATIARSRALDHLRSRRLREDREVGGEDALELAKSAVDDAPSAVAVLSSNESLAGLRGALSELPETQRTAIELAFTEGLSHTEVAARLDLPLGTIKSHIRRGLARLRAILEQEGESS